jgi:multicomponent Na+:H+ antiporter subunit E
MFLINVVLAMILASARGEMHAAGLAAGFVVGYIILWIGKPIFRHDDYFPRMAAAALFVLVFARELTTATLFIARAVLFRRRKDMHPNIITYDVGGLHRWEILLLSQCITLTPGTTTVDVSKDMQVLFIHAFDASDPAGVRQAIDKGLRDPMLKWTRQA